MLNTKERAFSFGALIQKTRDYFKAEKLWWGKRLGLTSEWAPPAPTWKLYCWIRYQSVHKAKSALHNFVEVLKFVPTCIFNFWKIPSAIKAFQEAIYQAERELREQYEKNSKLGENVDSAIEQIIEERWDNGHLNSIIEEHWINRNIEFKDGADNTKYFKLRSAKFLDESHKDYLSNLSNICFLYEECWGLRIPDQFLTEEKEEDRMWNEFDRSRCEAADLGPYDFDCFRLDINKSFYDSNKVWKEEFAKIEEEKKWMADNDC